MLDVRSAMRRTAAFNHDRIAVKSLGRELTFGESWDRGVRLANALLGMGLAGGDRVAVLEDNCIEAADFYVGSVAANLVRVPLYRAREGHRVYPPGLDERHPRLVLPAAAGRPGRPVPARGPYFTRIGIPVPPVWLGGGCNILYPRFDAQ